MTYFGKLAERLVGPLLDAVELVAWLLSEVPERRRSDDAESIPLPDSLVADMVCRFFERFAKAGVGDSSGLLDAIREVQAYGDRRAQQAVDKAQRAPGWQPIDTAPKDGTRVLLWYPDVGPKGLAVFGKWAGDQVIPEWIAEQFNADYWLKASPSHWAPEPEGRGLLDWDESFKDKGPRS